MQEFAPKQSRPSGNCPSDSELAAYIDGVLGKEDAARVTEHLASCESCFEVYTETVHFQLESEPPPKGKVVSFPRKILGLPPRAALAAAAVLVIGLSGGLFKALFAPPPELVTAELAPREVAEPLQKGPGLQKSFWRGPTYRGGEDGEEIPVDPAAFQIGVRLVNLQMSLEANDDRQASDDIAKLLQVLETQVGMKPLEDAYIELKQEILKDGAPPPRSFIEKAAQLNQETKDSLEALPLDLGQFVEAGRLSAIAQEASFFQQEEHRRFLHRIIRRQRFVQNPSFLFLSRKVWQERFGMDYMTIDPAALQALRDISDVLGNRDLRAEDYASLRQSFDEILKIYYPA